MASIKDTALGYVAPSLMKNIADLPEVSVNLDIQTKKLMNKEKNEEFEVSYFVLDGEEYRVPPTVLKSLQTILESKPDMEKFKVKKTGSGFGTEYTVIPL